MKRLITLLLLSASVSLAEEATLSINTVLRTDKSLVILKAGTVVQVLQRNEKTVSVKVGGKTGLIPLTALDVIEEDEASMMMVADPPARDRSQARPKTPSRARPAAPSPVAATGQPPRPASTAPRPAQTVYGKAVEKARANAASHDKNLVNSGDAIADGK